MFPGLLQLLIRKGGREEGNYCVGLLPCDAMQKVEMRALMMFLMMVLGDYNLVISPAQSCCHSGMLGLFALTKKMTECL